MTGNEERLTHALTDPTMRLKPLYEVEMDLDKIMLKEVDIDKTIEAVRRGQTTRTKGYPCVKFYKKGKYQLMDGKHRVAAKILEGKKKLMVNIVLVEVERENYEVNQFNDGLNN